MLHQFRKHYSREEARALLPQIRGWLQQLAHLRDRIAKLERRLAASFQQGHDVGGPTANDWIRQVVEFKKLLGEFHQRDIQVKDIERGLIDFPAILAGREVFLCWESDEEDIEFWHELDGGYAGRERL